MKKIISIFLLSFVLMLGITGVILISRFSSPIEEQESVLTSVMEKKQVFFCSKSSPEAESYILSKKEEIVLTLKYGEGIEGEIIIGKPISVRNTSDYYYIPVFVENKCIHIITVSKKGNQFSMNSGIMFSDVLNHLNSGCYCFENDSEQGVIYLRGNNVKIAVDGNLGLNFENVANSDEHVESQSDEKVVDIFETSV